MNKSTGILFLLLYVCGVTAILNENFLGPSNLRLLIQQSSLFAIVGIAAAFVIITGGIDLSIGSMVGLVGCVFAMAIKSSEGKDSAEVVANIVWILGWNTIVWGSLWLIFSIWDRIVSSKPLKFIKPIIAVFAGIGMLFAYESIAAASVPRWGMWLTICGSALTLALQLGLIHGILITRLRLQPFVVTLCGLMIYRSLSRWLTADDTKGFGIEYNDSLRLLATGKPCTIAFLLMIAGALLTIASLFVSLGHLIRGRNSKLLFSGVLLAIGICLTVSGGSRYLDGWEIEEGTPLVKIGNQTISTWTVKLGGEDATIEEQEIAANRPSVYLLNIGRVGTIAALVLAIGLTVGYFFKSQDAQSKRKFLPVIISGILCLICGFIVYQASIIASKHYSLEDFKSDFGVFSSLDVSPKAYFRIKMLLVMASLASFIASIAWLVRCLKRACGVSINGPLSAVATFAVMWWIGAAAPELQKSLVTFPFLIMAAIAAIAWIVLNKTVYGRYLLALGRNEEAARFSGINTDRIVLTAYVVCSGITAIFAILFALDTNSVQPSEFGNFIELYAIAAAVLGGCSLRGGEGAIIGVVIGASIMRILKSSLNLLEISGQLEFAMIGAVILLGALVDEIVRRIVAKRRTVESYADSESETEPVAEG